MIKGINSKMQHLIKKLAVFVLTLCFVASGFSMMTYAASGEIMFTDPSTQVGNTVEVRGVLKTASVEDRTIVMSYDTSMLKFKEGDSVTETASGQLTYEVTGYAETDGRAEFMMYFDVLKEGTTQIKVESYKAWTAGENYEEISCTVGSSTITIAEGENTADDPSEEPDEPTTEPTGDSTVVVNGVSYTLTSEFPQSDIPSGFEKTTMEYAGAQYSVVTSEKFGVLLGYLVDSENAGAFFLYVEDDATFAPYTEISISDTTSIILLNNVEGMKMPSQYTLTTVTVNGVEYPAWQDSENPQLCVLYAVNSNGVKTFYQFDSSENTYQKFTVPEVEEENTNNSFIGKLSDTLQNHMDMVILVTGIGFIFFLVLVIVLAVKLYNRNAELDEIYDEYGIDLDDEEEEVVKEVKKEKKKRNKKEVEEDEFIDIESEVEEDVAIEEATDSYEEIEEAVAEEEKEEYDIDIDLSSILEDDDEKVASVSAVAEVEAEEEYLDDDDSDDGDSDDDFYDDDDDDVNFEIDFIDLDD